jgi:hypothetical protein
VGDPDRVTGRCASPGWLELNSNSSMHELPFLIMRTLQPASGTPNAVFIGLIPDGMSAGHHLREARARRK